MTDLKCITSIYRFLLDDEVDTFLSSLLKKEDKTIPSLVRGLTFNFQLAPYFSSSVGLPATDTKFIQ